MGIDIRKTHLDIFDDSSGKPERIANTGAAITAGAQGCTRPGMTRRWLGRRSNLNWQGFCRALAVS
jgi:hypothetical protein